MRVQQAVDQYLEDLRVEARSPHTIAAYRRDLESFGRFSGNISIDSITPRHLTSFMATQTVQVRPCGQPRAAATINRYRVSLKALFAWCEARWLVKRNPTAILRCKRHKGLPPDILTEAEIHQLVSFPFTGRHAERDRALIVFMLATGCRLGETVVLNTGDIDWETLTVTLHDTKGGSPELITINQQVGNFVHPLAIGTPVTQPLFRSSPGNRLSTRQVQRIVTGRAIEAGITKAVTPHTLRHTFATRLYNTTGDIRLVQKALRHGHVTTTEIYAHVAEVRLKSATENCIQFKAVPTETE